jgi:hypothetical protein
MTVALVREAELAEDRADVCLDRLLGQPQVLRDAGVLELRSDRRVGLAASPGMA